MTVIEEGIDFLTILLGIFKGQPEVVFSPSLAPAAGSQDVLV